MTTAEAIEGITDAGMFEILATRVLRLTDEDCRLLEHMGVNAAGKTIPNPIDSFCQVPGAIPPRFIMAAYSTERLDTLERKWLFDHSVAPKAKKATAADDGDVIKAARRAQAIRNAMPDATFVLHLCTNKQLGDDLMAKVLLRAKSLGLEIQFLARSRLRDVLDTTAEGQWLRKEHLGIQAERLSWSLLRELSSKNLGRYEHEFLITPPESFVVTGSQRNLTSAVSKRRPIYIVTGASGTGKSVTCYQVLREHVESGGVGLWIPGEIASRATSLDEAITETVRSLHPTIETTAGAETLALLTAAHQLILVIDDINRGGSPAETLRKLLAWCRPSKNNQEDAARRSIVIPVWDLFWAPLDTQFRSASWLQRTTVDAMDASEARSCLVAAMGAEAERISSEEQATIADALGRDPILIALYADSVRNGSSLTPPVLAIEVIGDFVRMAQAEAAALSSHLVADFESSLLLLSNFMLANRELYPRWEDVQEALPQNAVAAIAVLTKFGKICRVKCQASENHFEFRHDRILEYFLTRALWKMLTDVDRNAQVISDPFYVSFLGSALATTDATDVLITWIERHAPLSLIASIRFLPQSVDGSSNLIISAARRWFSSAASALNTPAAMLFEAYRLLERTDSPFVLDITQQLAKHPPAGRARLANGSADAVLGEFADTRWFAPSVNDRTLDSALGRALHRHKAEIIAQCTELLQQASATDAARRGALVLAGFIGDHSLAAAVRSAWDLCSDKPGTVLQALWAGIRCGDLNPPDTLGAMMHAWAQLPDTQEAGGMSARVAVGRELQWTLLRGVHDNVLTYLIEMAQTIEALRWPIVIALQHLDAPIAIRFLLDEASAISGKLKGTEKLSPWLMSLRDEWDPTMDGRGRRLPLESLQVIRSCWEAETADPQLRETAFDFWVNATDDLGQLRTIPPNHPQFKRALWRRTRLGDRTTLPQVLPLLQSESHWFHNLDRVWSGLLKQPVDSALEKISERTPTDYSGGRTDEHYRLSELLRDIPMEDAEPFLLKHWNHLQFSPLFVQASLYLGTPLCVARARAAIERYPNRGTVFKHLGVFFGFSTTGLMDRIEHRHLEVLLPFLAELDDHTVSGMAEHCQRHGAREWALRHLKPEFDRRRAIVPVASHDREKNRKFPGHRYFPLDSDLLADLDWMERQGFLLIDYWSEMFDERHDTHERWHKILDEWLSKEPRIKRFQIVANGILRNGTRTDIPLLNKYAIEGDPAEVERLRASAEFGVKRRSMK